MSSVISRRVVNASPLIHLTEVGLLGMLHEPGVPVLVPEVVVAELGGLHPNDPAVLDVRAAGWIQIVPDPMIPPEVVRWNLDAGESAVLALALEQPGSQAVIDDLAARRCGQTLGVPLQGTVGLLLAAKQIGMISEVRPVLEQLRRSGMRLSDALVALAMQKAGE